MAQRKSLFVASKFQIFFIVYSIVVSMVPVLMLNLARFFTLPESSTGMMLMVWGLTVSILVLLFLTSYVLSNRLAGPIYRIQKHVDLVVSGQTQEKIKLREGDFFIELADSVNQLIRKATRG